RVAATALLPYARHFQHTFTPRRSLVFPGNRSTPAAVKQQGCNGFVSVPSLSKVVAPSGVEPLARGLGTRFRPFSAAPVALATRVESTMHDRLSTVAATRLV